MSLVVVPVRYPLSDHSETTLREGVSVAEARDADVVVLHVDLYQSSGDVSRSDLKGAVERLLGHVDRARYVVRRGFLVEETILEEVVAEDADVVVIGSKQAGRWRRMVQKLLSDPDVETFLRTELDCTVITVAADGTTAGEEATDGADDGSDGDVRDGDPVVEDSTDRD